MSHSSRRAGRPARTLLQCTLALCRRPLQRGVRAANADYYVKRYRSLGLALGLISYFLLDLKSLRELTCELRQDTGLGRLTGLGGISTAQLPKLLHERPAALWLPLLTHLLRRLPTADLPLKLLVLDTTFLAMGLKLFSRRHREVRCTASTAGYKAALLWSPAQATAVKLVGRAGQSNDAEYLAQLLPADETPDQVTYLFDRGFRQYAFWDELIGRGAGFITRAWNQLHFEGRERRALDPAHPQVLADEVGHVGAGRYRMHHLLRRITLDTERGPVVFLTSDLELEAWEVTELYRQRWQIEMFFRWLKRIVGCRKALAFSLQAAHHTLYAALATYLLLLIFANQALPGEERQGLVGLKIALRILRQRLHKPPAKALRKALGFS